MNFFIGDYNTKYTKKIEKLNCDLDTQIQLDYVLFYKLRDTIYHSSINVFQPSLLIKQSVYKKWK